MRFKVMAKGQVASPLWAYASLSGLCQDVLEGDISLGCSCDHHGGSKQLAHELRDQSDADSHSLWRDAIPDDAHQVIVRREIKDCVNECRPPARWQFRRKPQTS